MNKSIFLLITFSLLLLSSCFTVRDGNHFSYQKLAPSAYLNKIQEIQPHYLIDVRTPNEFKKSHLPQAINFSYFANHFDSDVDTLNRDWPVFLYCQTCHRSPLAAKILKKKGFKTIYDLKGGYSQLDTK